MEVRELGPSYRAANAEGTSRWVQLTRLACRPRSAAQTPRTDITFARLETIRVPVLLITCAADLYVPPSLLRLVARIKGARPLVIPECGHSAYWEQPDDFNRAVIGFIQGISKIGDR